MLGSLAYVVLISTKVISKITVTHISTILRLIFVDFDNPAQRKRCEFSKSYARVAMTTIHLNLIFAIFCRTIATIRNFAQLQPLSNVNPLAFLISLWEFQLDYDHLQETFSTLLRISHQCKTPRNEYKPRRGQIRGSALLRCECCCCEMIDLSCVWFSKRKGHHLASSCNTRRFGVRMSLVMKTLLLIAIFVCFLACKYFTF